MPANIWSFSCWSFLSCERISSLNAGEERERGGQREEQFNEVLKTDLEGSVSNWLSQANTRQHFPRPIRRARLQSAAAIAVHPSRNAITCQSHRLPPTPSKRPSLCLDLSLHTSLTLSKPPPSCTPAPSANPSLTWPLELLFQSHRHAPAGQLRGGAARGLQVASRHFIPRERIAEEKRSGLSKESLSPTALSMPGLLRGRRGPGEGDGKRSLASPALALARSGG